VNTQYKPEKVELIMKYLFIGLLSLALSLEAQAKLDQTHSKWDNILKEYTIKSENQVYFNYRDLKKKNGILKNYLKELEAVTDDQFNKFSRDQKLAFWINAYNAYTIQIVLDHYPLKSIKDISSGWFSSGPWKKEFITLLGRKMSLDDIEHNTIRKIFDEPRIHFAVNCASMGCPSLLQEAFTGEKLESQLEKATQNFLQNKTKNHIKNDTLYLSKIFKWYGDDFDKKHGGFKKFIIISLKIPEKDYSVHFNDYDWGLNELNKGK